MARRTVHNAPSHTGRKLLILLAAATLIYLAGRAIARFIGTTLARLFSHPNHGTRPAAGLLITALAETNCCTGIFCSCGSRCQCTCDRCRCSK